MKHGKLFGKKIRLQQLEISESELPVNFDIFNNLNEKPNHLNSSETKNKIQNTSADFEQRRFEVALQKKYSTPILPLIILLFTAPFALSLDKSNRVITVGYAVVFWLLYLGIGNTFEQFGLSGVISPEMAIWSPLAFFSRLSDYICSLKSRHKKMR